MNRRQIDSLMGADVARIVKTLQGRARRQVPWQLHAILVGELSRRGLGVREMHRMLRWSVGKVSTDLLLAKYYPGDLRQYEGTRRSALQVAQDIRSNPNVTAPQPR